MNQTDINTLLKKNAAQFHRVIRFTESTDKIALLNLSKSNESLNESVYSDTATFSKYINQLIADAKATYLIGGYMEQREMYRRSKLFDKDLKVESTIQEEPRCLHLGIDIWAAAGTEIFAPFNGIVHSYAFNNNFGDYGATIILQHEIDSCIFHTLYGHLSLRDIENIQKGQRISKGENFAHFGPPEENGFWPPHLHFQIISTLGNYDGDYPGVCKLSESAIYIQNCPDADLILQLNRFIK